MRSEGSCVLYVLWSLSSGLLVSPVRRRETFVGVKVRVPRCVMGCCMTYDTLELCLTSLAKNWN